jgi:Alginate lyase
MKHLQGFALLLCLLGASAGHADPAALRPPSLAFDLQAWKLDIPGPLEIRNLAGYANPHFYLNLSGEMTFHLDAAEPGHTPNTEFVRSELRHLPEWDVTGHHALTAVVRARSGFSPDKVTVVQIHGMTRDRKNAPPLLRVALNGGDLVAVIKTDAEGHANDFVPLVKGLGARPVKIDVIVEGGRLRILTDDQPKLDRPLTFWPYLNYFKAGCYPQATHGTGDVFFRRLSAY